VIDPARLGLLTVLPLLIAACHVVFGPDGYPPPLKVECTGDEQCGPSEVCFADGCGDPGRDIAVEVTPNNRAGQHAQDFAIERLQAEQDFRLVPATVLLGSVVRTGDADPQTGAAGPSTLYEQAISVRIFGESAIIPGLHRSFELTQAAQGGSFTMSAASGRYQGTLTTEDPSIPPQPITVELQPGAQTELTVTLPAADRLTVIRGQLFGTLLPLYGDTFLIEAFSATQAMQPVPPPPLAQATLTNPVNAEFELSLPTAVIEAGEPIRIRATPVSVLGLKPTQTFEVLPDPATMLQLQIGPVEIPTTLSGRAVDGLGRPVVNATVYVDALTETGASARSASVRTNADGTFSVQVLSNPTGGNGIWVVPQARHAAGQAQFFYPLGRDSQSVGDLVLPWRTPTRVTVVSPDELPADNALVVAEPIDALEGGSLPTFRREEVTAADGTIVLWLEPGIYRLDVNPGAPLPRTSRLVAVGSTTVQPGQQPPVGDVSTIRLNRGRTVTGKVVAADGERPLSGVMVRFFRVVELNRVNTHLLLAEATTDANGLYSVSLPTR